MERSSGRDGLDSGFPGGERLHRLFDAVGAIPWPGLGFQAEPGGPLFATRMVASLLVHAYSQGILSSEDIAEVCRTETESRYLCSGDAPEARILRRFRRMHLEALLESLSLFWTDPGTPVQPATRERARRCLDAAIAADSLALDF